MCICLQHTAYCVEKMIHSPKVRRAHFLFSFRLLLWPKLARPHNSSEKFPNVTFQAKLGSLCTFFGGFQQYFNAEKNAFHLWNNTDRPATKWIFHGNLSKSVRACNLCVIHGWAAAEQEEQQHLAWRLLQLLGFVLLLLLPKDNRPDITGKLGRCAGWSRWSLHQIWMISWMLSGCYLSISIMSPQRPVGTLEMFVHFDLVDWEVGQGQTSGAVEHRAFRSWITADGFHKKVAHYIT